jgi:xylose isomerase
MLNRYFPNLPDRIPFEGPGSMNPFAFRYYEPDRIVGEKNMADHLRFSVAYWHTMTGTGTDMFGPPAFRREWHLAADPLDRARDTMEAAFELFQKLGVRYYCFHDRDLAPEGGDFAGTCRNLETMIALAKDLQRETGVKVLWGTANLFSNPIYAQGAATNPDPRIMAHAAAQVKTAIDATRELGGENFVFWGGREGYETLLNTDMRREQEQMARFLQMAVEYKKESGFAGQLLIEPKPAEPTKHQYDFDAAATLWFLGRHGLSKDFKLNIEANHATLAGHTFEHELAFASAAGMLGSVDANRGDPMLGWDTDQFPLDIYDTTKAMLVILGQGGLGSGGLNFDAKVRRSSNDPADLFHGHIGGMDAFARGLLIAHEIIRDGVLASFIGERYAGFGSGIGAEIMSGRRGLRELCEFTLREAPPVPASGRQEMLENILNAYIR